jgi:hypothetical protein
MVPLTSLLPWEGSRGVKRWCCALAKGDLESGAYALGILGQGGLIRLVWNLAYISFSLGSEWFNCFPVDFL